MEDKLMCPCKNENLDRLADIVNKARVDEREKILNEPEKWFDVDAQELNLLIHDWYKSRTKIVFNEYINKPENLKRILRRKP